MFQNYQVDADAGQLGKHARIAVVKTPESTNYALTIVVTPADELKIKVIYHPNQMTRGTAEAIRTDLTTVLAAARGTALQTLVSATCWQRFQRGRAARHVPSRLRARRFPVQRRPPHFKAASSAELVAIWHSNCWSQKPVGIDDNFFDIGDPIDPSRCGLTG